MICNVEISNLAKLLECVPARNWVHVCKARPPQQVYLATYVHKTWMDASYFVTVVSWNVLDAVEKVCVKYLGKN